MTPRQNYIAALEAAVGYGISKNLTLQDICDGLILELGSVIGPAAVLNPKMDVDALLEIMRHQLDLKVAAFMHNGSATPPSLPEAPQKRLPPPPKESA